MNDAMPEVEKGMADRLSGLSSTECFRMAFSMFDAARKLIDIGTKGVTTSNAEVRSFVDLFSQVQERLLPPRRT